jgi:hypothetical protein
MHSFRFSSSVTFFALVIACAGPTASRPSVLDGTWIASAENASPSGWYQRSLIFGRAASFTSEFRSYGIYPGQPRDELSGYQRTEGTYEIQGNAILFHPLRLIEWDRFYGAGSPEQIREPYPYGSIFDDARYELHGLQLTLHYTVYPADAAEPTATIYNRAR